MLIVNTATYCTLLVGGGCESNNTLLRSSYSVSLRHDVGNEQEDAGNQRERSVRGNGAAE